MERHIQYSEIHRHNVHRILTQQVQVVQNQNHYHSHSPSHSPERKHHPQLVGINPMGHGYDGNDGNQSAVIEQLPNTKELNNAQADFDVLVAKLIHELERLKEETKEADKSCERLSFSTEMIKSFSNNKLL